LLFIVRHNDNFHNFILNIFCGISIGEIFNSIDNYGKPDF